MIALCKKQLEIIKNTNDNRKDTATKPYSIFLCMKHIAVHELL